MKVQFRIEDLERTVAPESLIDTLNSLQQNGLVTSYYLDFRSGDVFIDVPKDVEVKEIIAGFSGDTNPTGRKGSH